MKTQIIGFSNDIDNPNMYFMYFRDAQGFKHRILIFNALGIKDFYMCSDIPEMSEEEYKKLPNQIGELSINFEDLDK